MARKKQSSAAGQVDAMFAAIRSEARRMSGCNSSVAAESEKDTVGLPLPALCWRYLLQSTTFPMPRITQITGQEGCAKTSLLYEILRWHLIYGGGGAFIENEGKDQPDLRNSFMEWRPEWIGRLDSKGRIVPGTGRIDVFPSKYLEQWQIIMTMYLTAAKTQQDLPGGPGRTIPIFVGLDSIMGTAPKGSIDKIMESGHATAGYAIAARLVTDYMRAVPMMIGADTETAGYPFSIVGTNHLKPGMTAQGLPTSNIPGGKSVKFHENYELEMTHDTQKDIDRQDYGGLRLKILARKNSFGVSRRHIRAELLWWWQEDGKQVSKWDWDTASIELLLRFENEKGKRTIYKELQSVCDINVVNKNERTAWSKALGVPKSDPVYFRELGARLEQRPELLKSIYSILRITERCPFQPGVDYRTLHELAKAGAATQAKDLYERGQVLPNVEGVETEIDEVDDEDIGAPPTPPAEGGEAAPATTPWTV